MDNSAEIIGVTWIVVGLCILLYSVWDIRAKIISDENKGVDGDDLTSAVCISCVWPVILVIGVLVIIPVYICKGISRLITLSIPKSKR